MADKTLLKLLVQDTENIIFNDMVDRVTSYNEVGRFDVYPMHANFISIITKQIDIYQNRQKVKEIPIEQAIMKVKKDEIHIFLGLEMFYLEDMSDPTTPPETKK